jgi:acyl carrier protein
MDMVALNGMSREQLLAWVSELLAEMFGLELATLTPQSNLYADLDIDSIDAVDLTVKLTQLTGRRLSPQAFKSIRTIADVVDALSGLAAEPAV